MTGTPATGATGQIRLALDGKCLQDPGNNTANGARVQITNCVSGSTEKWKFAADGTIRINGRCLNVSGTSGYQGKAAQLQSCKAGPRQQWTVGSKGELLSPASGLCLTDPGASRSNGVAPVMGGCSAKSAEQWTMPAHQILTPLGGCVDDLHSVGSNGAIVDKFGCNNTIAQSWSFATNGMIRGGQYPADCLTAHGTKIALYRCATGDASQLWSVIRAQAASPSSSRWAAMPGHAEAHRQRHDPAPSPPSAARPTRWTCGTSGNPMTWDGNGMPVPDALRRPVIAHPPEGPS